MRTHALIVMMAGLSIAADAPKGDLGKLQGTWSLVSAVRDGKDVPDDEVSRTTLVIKGDAFTFPNDARVGTGPSGTFTIDPSRTPGAIDATPSAGPTKGETWMGIYEIAGDLYKVAFAPPGKVRPTRFVSEPGSGRLHSVWRRGTPADTLGGDPARADLETLQGRWKIASLIVDGREVEDTEIKGTKLVLEGDEYKAILGEQILKVRLKLDPSRTPKVIDMTYRDESTENRTFRGIYKLDGDTVTICRPTRPEGQRPTEFAAPADSKQILIVVKREKP
jgi:uncharacterized protein (TIGR03067 family)